MEGIFFFLNFSGNFRLLFFTNIERLYSMIFANFHILYPLDNDSIANITDCGIIFVQNLLLFYSLQLFHANRRFTLYVQKFFFETFIFLGKTIVRAYISYRVSIQSEKGGAYGKF